MKKVMIIIMALLMLSFVIGIGRRPFYKQQEDHLDTLLFVSNSNDTMYFVINENGDTVDWFMYWDSMKLDRRAMDYLYHLPDSFRE
jgi:hypothetical protein